MVVNRNPAKPAELTLTFSDGVESVGEVDRSKKGGAVRPFKWSGRELKMTLAEGDGRLLQVNAAP